MSIIWSRVKSELAIPFKWFITIHFAPAWSVIHLTVYICVGTVMCADYLCIGLGPASKCTLVKQTSFYPSAKICDISSNDFCMILLWHVDLNIQRTHPELNRLVRCVSFFASCSCNGLNLVTTFTVISHWCLCSRELNWFQAELAQIYWIWQKINYELHYQ